MQTVRVRVGGQVREQSTDAQVRRRGARCVSYLGNVIVDERGRTGEGVEGRQVSRGM